jgi:Rrf2 family protein
MRMSEGVESSLHCCTVLAALPPGTALPVHRLAEFHGVPAAYLGKHLQKLRRAGILESLPGRSGGFRLARSAADITLRDVVEAVDGDEPAFRCNEIRRRGPSAVTPGMYTVPCAIARTMWRAEAAWRAALAEETIAGIAATLPSTVDPEQQANAALWLQEVLS